MTLSHKKIFIMMLVLLLFLKHLNLKFYWSFAHVYRGKTQLCFLNIKHKAPQEIQCNVLACDKGEIFSWKVAYNVSTLDSYEHYEIWLIIKLLFLHVEICSNDCHNYWAHITRSKCYFFGDFFVICHLYLREYFTKKTHCK